MSVVTQSLHLELYCCLLCVVLLMSTSLKSSQEGLAGAPCTSRRSFGLDFSLPAVCFVLVYFLPHWPLLACCVAAGECDETQ